MRFHIYVMNHIHAYIHSISIPLFYSLQWTTPGSGNGGRHLHGSTPGHCPPRRRDMTPHGEQRASHRGLGLVDVGWRYSLKTLRYNGFFVCRMNPSIVGGFWGVTKKDLFKDMCWRLFQKNMGTLQGILSMFLDGTASCLLHFHRWNSISLFNKNDPQINQSIIIK